MKIENLTIKNFKAARSIDIYASETNEIAGNNGQGKSTILDAIVAALAGARGIPSKPITDGEVAGEISLDLGDITVIRSFTEGKTSQLEIRRNDDGSKMKQSDLNMMVDSLSFDPTAFARMKPTECVEKMRALAGDEYNRRLADLKADEKKWYDARADKNREIKLLGKVEKVELCEKIDVLALHAEAEAIRQYNAQQNKKAMMIENAQAALDSLLEDKKRLDAKIEKLSEEITSLPQPEKMRSPIDDQVAAAAEVNARAERYIAYRAKADKISSLTSEAMEYDAALESVRTQIADHMKAIPISVEGVEVRDDGVYVNGIPFQSLSASERIKFSTEFGISLNKDLNIMLIYDGSLLDDESFKWIIETAKARGCQLWIETVGGGRTGDALIIENGKVRVKDDSF